MSEFAGVVPALSEALTQRGYTELTPVQRAVLAPEFGGVDMLVSAQTGSGKTVAFGMAIAPTLLGEDARFEAPDAPLALMVAPTRELALQVKRELEWLYALTGASVASCVGGMDMRTERRALDRGAHIVVGTPGRLKDHIQRSSLDMSQLRAVVLDEADEMLDLGFKEDLEFILAAAPETRRTLMFSATVPRSIANLAKSYQRDAVRIATAEEQKQHLDIEYRALMVVPAEQENAIINVLRFYEAKNALVFCNTRANVNHMVARFNNRGFSVVALSGELSQAERSHALQAMRDGRARVCIATDVAARGIDLPNLELVIHADLPTNREMLLHRSGRTGRAGRKGVSVLIVPQKAAKRAERLLGAANISAKWAKPPSIEDVMQRDDERILADPILSEPVQDEEKLLIAQIQARHGAEQIAAAFVRLYRAGQSAPEELMDVAPPETRKQKAGGQKDWTPGGAGDGPRPPRPAREDFGDSVWVSLSVGRKHNAEPRWLLPMLCTSGGITKREIGAIKMQNEETFVQLRAECADGFLAALGPNRVLEDNIRVKRLDGVPVLRAEPFLAPRPGGAPKKPKRRADFAATDGGAKARPASGKPAENRSFEGKPKGKRPGNAPGKPYGKPGGKFGGKPSFGAGAKPRKTDKGK